MKNITIAAIALATALSTNVSAQEIELPKSDAQNALNAILAENIVEISMPSIALQASDLIAQTAKTQKALTLASVSNKENADKTAKLAD